MADEERRYDRRGFWGIVLAQFLGAFNDNGLRWFLIAYSLRDISPKEQGRVITWASFLFLFPYVIFSMHAGSLADRYAKRSVLIVSKSAEAVIMALCAAFLLFGGGPTSTLTALLSTLCLLGVQATYYSPAKFGVLPELLPERYLSWGNGIFEMTGVLAIILGSICGAEFIRFFAGALWLAPAVFFAAAILGLAATCLVPQTRPVESTRQVIRNPLLALAGHGKKLIANRILLLTLLSVVFLWSMGLFFQLNVALYAKINLGLEEHAVGWPLGLAAMGIGLGNVLAGYVSGRTIEMGLVPFAAMGVAGSTMALAWTASSPWASYAMVGLMGFFAGLFIVPTHAVLQEESDADDKGGIWAATNFLQTLGMLIAAGAFRLLEGPLDLKPPAMFLVSGMATLIFLAGLSWVLPETLGRSFAWILSRRSRGLRIEGQSHIPVKGSILFLVSGPPGRDGFLLLAGTRRFVKFVLPRAALREGIVRPMARCLGAIVFESGASPEALRGAFAAAHRALGKGDAVAVFADLPGADPTGRRELLAGVVASPAPIVPVSIDSVDGGRSKRVRFEASLPPTPEAIEAWLRSRDGRRP